MAAMRLSRKARIGALCWTAAAPLFVIAQVVTGLGWRNPSYSWATNNISDLGNVHCGVWDSTRPRYVCSPWHPLMNVSLLLTAALLAAGLVLTWRALGQGVTVHVARALLLFAAVGYALAGAYPADIDENRHVLGAVLILVLGNIGLSLAGLASRTSALGRLRVPTLATGMIALAGTVLFFAQQSMGIGVGAMQRVAVFPLLLWAGGIGATLLARARPPAWVGRPAETG